MCGPGVECDEGGVNAAPLLCRGAVKGLTLGAGGASGFCTGSGFGSQGNVAILVLVKRFCQP